MKIIKLLAGIAITAISLHAQSFFPTPSTNVVVLNSGIRLNWKANPEPDVLGYKLRVTNPVGVFNYEITNRLTTNVLLSTVTGPLTPGNHSFRFSAVNNAGMESAPFLLTTNIVAIPSTPTQFKVEGVLTITPLP